MTVVEPDTEHTSENEVKADEVPETESSPSFWQGLSIFGHRLLSSARVSGHPLLLVGWRNFDGFRYLRDALHSGERV